MVLLHASQHATERERGQEIHTSLPIATVMAYAAKYRLHCRGEDMWEVALAPFLRRRHNLVVLSKVWLMPLG